MDKKIVIILILLLVSSCVNRDENSKYHFDEKTNTLYINNQYSNKVERIVVRNHSRDIEKQVINLDKKDHFISAVNTYKTVWWKKENYLNTKIVLDYEGNLENSQSTFYQVYLYEIDKKMSAEITLNRSILKGGETYLLSGEIDNNYKIKGKVDTVFFINDKAILDIKQKKAGLNSLRFLICSDKIENKITNRKIIFGNLKFFI